MILITGGTGFVGQEVVRTVLGLGLRVRLLVRDPERATAFAHNPQVELMEGDALRPETLPAAMTGVNAVINLIGIIAETSKLTFEQGHVETTRNLLAAAQKTGVTRWVQMSAAGTRSEAISRYHITKWEAEELVRQSGLDWTVFRPSLIYGYDERDRLLNFLRLALSWPLLHSFPLLDGGVPLVQPVSVREVAHCFAHAVAKEASLRKTYDLVGPVALSWRDMVFKAAIALGKKPIYEDIPILMALRTVLRLAVIALPILFIVGLNTGRLNLAQTEICFGLWAVLVIVTSRWKQLILFNIPSAILLFVSKSLQPITPRGLQVNEQLKMTKEDNVGDPKPAATTFGYVPESFDEGLARVMAR